MPPGQRARSGLVLSFALASLVAFVAIGLALSTLVGRRLIERQVEAAEFHARFVAETILRHELRPRELNFLTPLTGERYGEFRGFVNDRVLRWPIIRLTIWRSDGMIVFSEDPSLVGQLANLADPLKQAFRQSAPVSVIMEGSRRHGPHPPVKHLDTYVPVFFDANDPGGIPVAMVQLSQDYAGIEFEVRHLFRTVTMTLVAGLAFLYVSLLPIMVRVSRTLSKQNARLEEQAEERRRLLDTVLRTSEEERKLLAAELHDGPIQRLAGLGYRLERARNRLERGNAEGAAPLLTELQEGLSEETRRLREMMAELRPPVLDQRGLDSALRDHAAAFGRSWGVGCTVRSSLDERLDPDIETVLYRVAQEALANVAKHAHAGKAWVSLAARNGSVILEVGDDGIGFDPLYVTTNGSRDHFGLTAMRERVEMAGGRWEIQSRPGGGTRVVVEFPRERVMPR
ncbi:MAG TPA: sensor histidine kinase [Actinomycetota bacterium]|jgi:two-component system NarL family sensor kinase|nr:sensor histidine kinase [Actinomycetota bacterium]